MIEEKKLNTTNKINSNNIRIYCAYHKFIYNSTIHETQLNCVRMILCANSSRKYKHQNGERKKNWPKPFQSSIHFKHD